MRDRCDAIRIKINEIFDIIRETQIDIDTKFFICCKLVEAKNMSSSLEIFWKLISLYIYCDNMICDNTDSEIRDISGRLGYILSCMVVE